MKEQKPMRKQIEQAIRNEKLTVKSEVVNLLLASNLDDLLAIEVDNGLDSQGTIVHMYMYAEDMLENGEISVVTELFSNVDAVNQDFYGKGNALDSLNAYIQFGIEKWNTVPFAELNDQAKAKALYEVTKMLKNEEAEEAEEEREAMSHNQLREVAHSLLVEGVYTLYADGRIAKK
jgi:hypothetical protein